MLITFYDMSHLSLFFKVYCKYNGVIYTENGQYSPLIYARLVAPESLPEQEETRSSQTRNYFYHASRILALVPMVYFHFRARS